MRNRAATRLCVGLVCALAAGCGGAATAARPRVRVVVVAPTDGSTVTVHALEVIGDVSPRTATVSVNGHAAMLAAGQFRLPVVFNASLTRIAIVARAPGYETWTTSLTVHYARPSPGQPSAPAPARTIATGQPDTGVLGPADRICAARNRKVLALPILTPSNIATLDVAMAAINATTVAELRALEQSPAGRAILGPYVDDLATAMARSARIRALLKAGNAASASKLAQKEVNRGTQLAAAPAGQAMPDCGRAALMSAGSGRE